MTVHVDLDQVVAAEVAGTDAADLHPELDCRTCGALVAILDKENPPASNVCLGASRNPNVCNTWAMRHKAGLDQRLKTAEYEE